VNARRGLGVRARLVLISSLLALLPWLVLQYQREIDAFVLEGRSSALRLAAQGIATVLHDREEWFDETGGLPVLLGDEHDFAPLPLEAPVALDGNGRDWGGLALRRRHYGREAALLPGEFDSSLEFDLSLGRRGGWLYTLFEVRDDAVTYRPANYRRLDASDHLRITLPARDIGGAATQYVVTVREPGPVTAYPVGESWSYALGDGLPDDRVRGQWRAVAGGYTLELRLPIELLGPSHEVGFALVDVDRPGGSVASVVGTFPRDASGDLNLVLLNSPEIERILRGLDLPGARISVVDHLGRVRADVGAPLPGSDTTRASWPIRDENGLIGTVRIEQSNREILGHQRAALERVLIAMAAACAAIAGALWWFAWRLGRRLRRLRDEASGAIDENGRIRRSALESERGAGDELGDLSRSISDLLARLSRYTSFLEQLPRTLRHEISNPLNTLSTSLQNLVHERPELEKSRYIESAERGVARVGEILEGLTVAASFEESLHDDELEEVDLAELTRCYVESFAAVETERSFQLRVTGSPVRVRASAFRLEQLLDKLVDNAVSFSTPGSAIEIALSASKGSARLSVANEGPPLPEGPRAQLFDSMVTSRPAGGGNRAHLGIGLYAVRLIAEHAGGAAEARDRADGNGVVVRVELPLAA